MLMSCFIYYTNAKVSINPNACVNINQFSLRVFINFAGRFFGNSKCHNIVVVIL